MVKLTIYSKKDCHLCDVAKEKLIKLKRELQFSINEVDIEKDSEAFEKYKYLIPVVEMDGKTISTYRINEDELKYLIRQKSRPG
ncbi:MAG: glutaredoxin family protein [Candidatus Methanoperedens sp.]|nr:glutaredoxin family protein [Candidatus Methanoperedens sp.]